MQRVALILIIIFSFQNIFCQESEIILGLKDKLKQHHANDTTKVNLYNDLAWEYSYVDYRKSISYCNEAIKVAKQLDFTDGEASGLSIIGNNYRALYMYDSAFYFLQQSLDIRKAQGKKSRIAAVLHNIANIYTQENKYTEAISTYKEALNYAKGAKDNRVEFFILTNLAQAYRSIGLHKNAIQYLNRAFEINKVLKDKIQEATLYATISTIQCDQGDIDAALESNLKGLEIISKLNQPSQEAIFKLNLGLCFKLKNNITQSMYYYQEALRIYQNLGDSLSMGYVLSNFASLCNTVNKFDEAIQASKKANRIAQDVMDTTLIFNSYLILADAYNRTNNQTEALKYAFLAEPLVVSIHNKENLKSMYSTFFEIYYHIQDYKNATHYLIKVNQLADSIYTANNHQLAINLGIEMGLNEKESEIEILNKNAQIKEIEIERKKSQQWFFIGVIFLCACVIIVTVIAFRKTKKQNLIIENQKQQVELKNEEIVHQKELVEEKATELAVKQKEIIDSINYAKRIQQAVLTGEEVWHKISPEHFILFMPKDIVSGDFYWAYHTPNNRSIFVLADCTGHGVPGGFMSMLGNSFLNEIIVEGKIFKADEILNKLRAKIISALEQKGATEQKDGMDMALCVWNKLDNTLEFAGANNPLWLVRNNELIEYKANKMPIGTYTEDNKPFTSVTINLQKGDTLYLTTDGYADQFGGEKGKKLKYKPLIEHLLKINHQDMPQQKQLLEKLFLDWRGKYDQIDDVSVIGIRV